MTAEKPDQFRLKCQRLLELALKGDRPALNDLFALIRPEMHGIIRGYITRALQPKMDASDVVQSTLQEAFVAFADFRGETIEQFWAWLSTIHRNNAKSEVIRFQTQRRDPGKEVPLDSSINASVTSDAGERLQTEEMLELRKTALHDLTEADQAIINLRVYQGLSYMQIAKLLGEKEMNLRKRYSRAFVRWEQRIQQLLKEGGGQAGE